MTQYSEWWCMEYNHLHCFLTHVPEDQRTNRTVLQTRTRIERGDLIALGPDGFGYALPIDPLAMIRLELNRLVRTA